MSKRSEWETGNLEFPGIVTGLAVVVTEGLFAVVSGDLLKLYA